MMKDTVHLHWLSASRTHVGMVRKLNEDSVLELTGKGIWAVADGMGGHAAGDYASQAVVEALTGVPVPGSLGDLVGEVRQRLQAVSKQLCDVARKRHEQTIGSTAVVLLSFGEHVVAVWAGDSRVYRYREGELQQLTHDHSQVEELVSQGLITREQAEHHPASNIITRAVGVSEHLELDAEMFEVNDGDIFLLCSDGLYNEVSDNEITDYLAVTDCQSACDLLVDRALANGARDNVSVVVVRAVDQGQITRTQFNPSVNGGRLEDGDDGEPTHRD